MPQLLIVSIENDIHAHSIAFHLERDYGWSVFILEVDRLSTHYSLSFTVEDSFIRRLSENKSIAFSELDIVWWRRSKSSQVLDSVTLTPAQIDVINQDCRSALYGGLLAHFRGVWVSEPFATEAASFKPLQLQVAHNAGLQVPKTLISDDPQCIRQFVRMEGRKIIKPVAGTKEQILYTQEIESLDQISNYSLSICPAVYQEYIEGHDHLRVSMFGDSAHCAVIRCEELDWRGDLTGGITTTDLPYELLEKLRLVLRRLRLEMGIFDLKRNSRGEYVFFEVNPQGQFLFVEGISKFDLTGMFCGFINRLGRDATTSLLHGSKPERFMLAN